ncbi:MAG: filamentous hemagglutinin N-terminal domain-containing protein [Xenococcaceae cyanobacterium MO_167.B27]|nr:filamentous hemagglutinin N-terminal domain-containing protein [Xenococcaceae cyanobacterium MO_167.B27]
MKQLIRRFSLVVSLNLISLLFSGAAKGQQISPDGTLPTNVDLLGNVFEITGGATEGSNLFHSFGEFSVPNGFEAFFNNGLSIENIISRVTGGSISSIDGLIRANGSANLILINPAGISFGSGASLDIGGAFLGSSANSIRFEDGTVFSANPNQTPLLTVTAPIGVGFAPNPGDIQSQGANLSLKSGNTFALIGGNVSLDSTSITTPSGNIEIASVGSNESVSLTAIPQGWELGFEGVSNFQDIQFSLGTLKSGEINIIGQDISLTGSIWETEGATSNNPGLNEVSGDISIIGRDISITEESRLAATERIEVPQPFGPSDFIYSPFGGDIIIQGENIIISQGTEALLPTLLTRGNFGAGNITIQGRNITITEGSQREDDFEFFNPVDTIDADSLSNQLSGTITIDGEQIIIDDSVGISSEIWNQPESIQGEPARNIGGIFIGTNTSGNRIIISGRDNIPLGDGNTQIITDTHGFHLENQTPGIANNIEIGNINSQQVILEGGSEINAESHPHTPGMPPEGFFGNRTDFNAGRAGSITIRGQQVNIRGEDTRVTATSFGSGIGGDITIEGENIAIENQAAVLAETGGTTPEAEGGSISIGRNFTNNQVIIDNATVSVTTGTTIAESHGNDPESANAPAGNISIGSPNSTLDILNGSVISASTIQAEGLGFGNAGLIQIDANQFNLIQNAVVASQTETFGDAGNIVLTIGDLLQIQNSSITARTTNSGDAGNIGVFTNSLLLDSSSSILSTTTSSGNAGDIVVFANSLELDNNSSISSNSSTAANSAQAGNIFIATDSLSLDKESSISSDPETGSQGNIDIRSNQVILRNNSTISTDSEETSDGGNINISGFDSSIIDFDLFEDILFEDSEPPNPSTSADFIALLEGSNITANAEVGGTGGRITIDADGIFQCGDCLIQAEGGISGIVEINTPNVQNNLEFLDVPQQVITSEQVVVSACDTDKGKQANQFTITGRGGLPPSPTSPLTTEALISFDADNELQQNSEETNNLSQDSEHKEYPSPAKGWYVNAQGNLILAANIPNGNPNNSGDINPDCNSISHNQ